MVGHPRSWNTAVRLRGERGPILGISRDVAGTEIARHVGSRNSIMNSIMIGVFLAWLLPEVSPADAAAQSRFGGSGSAADAGGGRRAARSAAATVVRA